MGLDRCRKLFIPGNIFIVIYGLEKRFKINDNIKLTK